MATAAGLRMALERGFTEAWFAIARGRLKKEQVGTLVQLASEYADKVHRPHVDLTGVPWTQKPDAIRRWLLSK